MKYLINSLASTKLLCIKNTSKKEAHALQINADNNNSYELSGN